MSTFSGMGAASPEASACSFTKRDAANTSVLYKPPIGAKAPTVSPYSVEYPIMASDRLPVLTTSQPVMLEMAMRMIMRHLAWVFSAATPPNPPMCSDRMRPNAWNGSLMDICCVSMPSARASSWASMSEWLVEYGPGIRTPCTCSLPKTSQQRQATRLESMPPESPMTTSVADVSSAKSRSASTQTRCFSAISIDGFLLISAY